MEKNKIYFGDNLEVMRDMEERSIDLIATDPPFNSGRDYNIFLPKSEAQKKAFTDTWKWDDTAIEARSEIEELAKVNSQYEALNQTLIRYDHILNFELTGSKAKLRSYLTFMGPRLIEMHRLLKDTGSLYLHCDPTASHYLKGLLDSIFGNENFRNEIIWSYSRLSRTSDNQFPRMNDIIYFYSKKFKKNIFNKQYTVHRDTTRFEKGYHTLRENGQTKLLIFDLQKAKNANVDFSKYDKVVKTKMKQPLLGQVWNDINFINGNSKERTGYPTQKPRALYKRILKASSKENDTILDPFCGCGTTLDAAQALNRKWIGIDITNLALAPMEQRLTNNYNLIKGKDYEIIGYPTTMQEVWKFVKDEKKHHDFANWAVAQLGLQATQNIGDGGFDGVGIAQTWTAEGMKQVQGKVIAEVKTGNISKTQVRAFCQTMNDQQAIVGIIVTLYPPTKAMREYQQKLGKFEHNNKSYQKLQIWQIDDRYFEDNGSIKKQIKLPWMIEKIKKI